MESLIVTLPWHLHPATSEHPCLNSAMKQCLALLESLPGNVLEGNFSAQQIAVGLSSMGMDALRVWKEFSATRMDSSGGTVRASQCLSHTCDRLTWSDQGTSVPTWGKFSFGDLQRNHFGVSCTLLPFYKAMHQFWRGNQNVISSLEMCTMKGLNPCEIKCFGFGCVQMFCLSKNK